VLSGCLRRANEEVQRGFSSDDEMEECSSDWPSAISLLKDNSSAIGEPMHGKLYHLAFEEDFSAYLRVQWAEKSPT
jgi:hypothetical protein